MTAEAITDRLISAGIERKTAETVASILSDSKADTAQARADADAKIAEARAEAKQDNANLKGEFNTAVERLDGRMEVHFSQLEVRFSEFREEMKEHLAKMDVRIAKLEAQMRITMYLVAGIFLAVVLPLFQGLGGS